MKIKDQPFEIQILGEDDQPVTETREGYAGIDLRKNHTIRMTNTSDTHARASIKIGNPPFETAVIIGKNESVDQKIHTELMSPTDPQNKENVSVNLSVSFTRGKMVKLPPMRSLLPRAGLSDFANPAFFFSTDIDFPPVTMNMTLCPKLPEAIEEEWKKRLSIQAHNIGVISENIAQQTTQEPHKSLPIFPFKPR